MTEYEILTNSLVKFFGKEKSKKILEQFKIVIKENHLEYAPQCLRDFLRLAELEFNPSSDKYYGKC